MSILHINHLSWWAWCQSLSPLFFPSHFVLPWFFVDLCKFTIHSPLFWLYHVAILQEVHFYFYFCYVYCWSCCLYLTMVLVVCNYWMVLNFEWIEKSLDLGGEGAHHNQEIRYKLYEPLYFQFHSTFYIIKNVSSWFCNLFFLLQ